MEILGLLAVLISAALTSHFIRRLYRFIKHGPRLLVDDIDGTDTAWIEDLRSTAATYTAYADYTPKPYERDEYEDIFGSMLATGHSVKQAARFLIELGNDRL